VTQHSNRGSVASDFAHREGADERDLTRGVLQNVSEYSRKEVVFLRE